MIDSLPEKLTAAPRRVLASRQPLGQLSFNSSAAESVEDEYGAEDSVFEEDDGNIIYSNLKYENEILEISVVGRASQSSEYESVASTHYYTPRAQLERESHADLIYGCPEYAESIYAYLREREVLLFYLLLTYGGSCNVRV